MILFDLVGDCDLQIPLEANSDPAFTAGSPCTRAATDSPFGGRAPAILDDHVPFLEAGVGAVDLIDFTFGPGAVARGPSGIRPRTRSTRSARRASTRSARRCLPSLPGSGDVAVEEDTRGYP